MGGSRHEQQNALLDKGWEVVEWAPLLAIKPMEEKLVALTKQAVELRAEYESSRASSLVSDKTSEANEKDLEELGEQLRLVVERALALPKPLAKL